MHVARVKARVRLTRIQADILEMYRQGMSESQIVKARTGQTCTHHYHKVALRRKGAISRGKQGVKGSVKVLLDSYDIIAPRTVIDPNMSTITPLASVSA